MWIGPDGEMPDAQTIGPSAAVPRRASISSASRSLQTAGGAGPAGFEPTPAEGSSTVIGAGSTIPGA